MTTKLTALTFDDGPTMYSSRLQDLLYQYGVKVTFFFIGKMVKRYPKLAESAANLGHEIANHTWSHPQLIHLTDKEFIKELEQAHSIILDTTGKTPTLFRPPYGYITKAQRSIAQELFGYQTVLWNFDTKDWKQPNQSILAKEIQNHLESDQIILMHETHESSINAVNQVLSSTFYNKSNFVTTSEIRLRLLKPYSNS
ncbi:polysaccharide deacetylase family protein [Prosthecobacter dejongeii]|uniref:Peptidoglycan/xylan/chitin deacetylase (PgdA/CDA1 family) n=1 Tax=Prosthecobacter dejongeii TaxID=48465 RepID=A0A7W7YNB2_9BACT|nr:polysaccharide deacetylase family protein [Prosthecobacter dejongeii]MBB5039328.1 peptidoglycan/xylan/chitin deacetylase (PgdA/CDA1 family) [Prosthecobacter dejongeii]